LHTRHNGIAVAIEGFIVHVRVRIDQHGLRA
jgi:hypothetical protein